MHEDVVWPPASRAPPRDHRAVLRVHNHRRERPEGLGLRGPTGDAGTNELLTSVTLGKYWTSVLSQANAAVHSIVQPRVLPGLAYRLSGNIMDTNMLFVRVFLSGNSRRGRCRKSRVDSHPVHPLRC